jgi:hypothetical protein
MRNWLQHKVTVYRWPLIVTALCCVAAAIKFGTSFFWGLLAKFSDEKWLIENVFLLIVFTFFVNWVISLAANDREKRKREPFEGWQFQIVNGDRIETTKIFWSEAEKYLNSEFERWRGVKTMMTTLGNLTTPNIEAARNKWLTDPMASVNVDNLAQLRATTDKTIIIDIIKIGSELLPPR